MSIRELIALVEKPTGQAKSKYPFLFSDDEKSLIEYQSIRDWLVLTNKKLISIDVQGITGKKTEFYCLTYRKISAFSLETAGRLDVESTFTLWTSGAGEINFSIAKGEDTKKLVSLFSDLVG